MVRLGITYSSSVGGLQAARASIKIIVIEKNSSFFITPSYFIKNISHSKICPATCTFFSIFLRNIFKYIRVYIV